MLLSERGMTIYLRSVGDYTSNNWTLFRISTLASANTMAWSRTIFAAFLYASYTLAHPQSVVHKDTIPSNLAATWYQAPLWFSTSASTNASCGWTISSGILNTTQCYVLYTDALGLQQDEHHECMLKVWDGVSDCSGNDSWTSYAVPSGKDKTCVETGVLDGGKFQHKSCVLTCF